MHDRLLIPGDAREFVAHREQSSSASFPYRDRSIQRLRSFGFASPESLPLGLVQYPHPNSGAEYASDFQTGFTRVLESTVKEGRKTTNHWHPNDLGSLLEVYFSLGDDDNFFMRINGQMCHITEPFFIVEPGVIHQVDGIKGDVHLLIIMVNAFYIHLNGSIFQLHNTRVTMKFIEDSV